MAETQAKTEIKNRWNWRYRVLWVWMLIAFAAVMVQLSACTTAYKRSLGANTVRTYHRIFLSDFNTVWLAGLDALKNAPLDISNREAGFIQTKWVENTEQLNFTNVFGAGPEQVIRAQFRFRISAAKGTFNGKESVKVSVQKEQLIQNDVLDGWRETESDGVEENTLLYRMGQITVNRIRLQQIQEAQIEQDLPNANSEGGDEGASEDEEVDTTDESQAE